MDISGAAKKTHRAGPANLSSSSVDGTVTAGGVGDVSPTPAGEEGASAQAVVPPRGFSSPAAPFLLVAAVGKSVEARGDKASHGDGNKSADASWVAPPAVNSSSEAYAGWRTAIPEGMSKLKLRSY